MLDDVAGDEREPVRSPNNRFELGPLRLELFLAFDLLAFGHLLELGVNLRALLLVEVELRQPALVVDGNGRLVLDRALDVVDADVVAEDGAGVRVLKLDGGSGEADEGCFGEGIAHVRGKAVDEVVLAPVGLVRDDDNVPPVREQRVLVALLFGEELLDRREYHASRLDGELPSEVCPGSSLAPVAGEVGPGTARTPRTAGRRGRSDR